MAQKRANRVPVLAKSYFDAGNDEIFRVQHILQFQCSEAIPVLVQRHDSEYYSLNKESVDLQGNGRYLRPIFWSPSRDNMWKQICQDSGLVITYNQGGRR